MKHGFTKPRRNAANARSRRLDDPNYPPAATNDDASFAASALIIAAILIMGGYFVVTYNSDNVRTASANTPGDAERTHTDSAGRTGKPAAKAVTGVTRTPRRPAPAGFFCLCVAVL